MLDCLAHVERPPIARRVIHCGSLGHRSMTWTTLATPSGWAPATRAAPFGPVDVGHRLPEVSTVGRPEAHPSPGAWILSVPNRAEVVPGSRRSTRTAMRTAQRNTHSTQWPSTTRCPHSPLQEHRALPGTLNKRCRDGRTPGLVNPVSHDEDPRCMNMSGGANGPDPRLRSIIPSCAVVRGLPVSHGRSALLRDRCGSQEGTASEGRVLPRTSGAYGEKSPHHPEQRPIAEGPHHTDTPR